MAEYFIAFLIDYVRVAPKSASSYLSHVVHRLFCDGVIDSPGELRTARVTRILRGFDKLAPTIPLRERVRVPCTVNIAIAALTQIPSLTSDPLLTAALTAALALGYGLSLRPQEYLLTPRPVPLAHQANASLAFFWFQGTPYCVTEPALFPTGAIPDAFSLFLDFNKNNQSGQGGPRSVWRSPYATGFCCVKALFTYLVAYPPQPQSPLLSGVGFRVTAKHISRLFAITATTLGLPAGRLLPHSIRSGAIVQLVAAHVPVQLLLDQGDWHTLQGLRSYAHTSLEHARDKTAALHDISLVPVSQSVHQYSRHSS
jgi:hypothetical protein